MDKKLITPLILITLFFGGKAFLESEGDRTARLAEEMYQDKLYEDALSELRGKDRFLGWTVAFKESDELRGKIRKKLTAHRKFKEDEAKNDRLRAQWEREDKERLRQEKEQEIAEEAARRTFSDSR